MQVETYECQETITEPLEASEEAISIIEKLGMEGQQKLISKNSKDGVEQKERCPYRKMKADEIFVYRTLCPEYTALKTFSECPIPLRVLQVVAHAESLGIFEQFQVWSARGAVKDPVIVASETDRSYGMVDAPYILARWGDELDEWPILVKKALEMWKEKALVALRKIQNQVKSDLELIEKKDVGLTTAMHRETPSYYGWE